MIQISDCAPYSPEVLDVGPLCNVHVDPRVGWPGLVSGRGEEYPVLWSRGALTLQVIAVHRVLGIRSKGARLAIPCSFPGWALLEGWVDSALLGRLVAPERREWLVGFKDVGIKKRVVMEIQFERRWDLLLLVLLYYEDVINAVKLYYSFTSTARYKYYLLYKLIFWFSNQNSTNWRIPDHRLSWIYFPRRWLVTKCS